MGYLKKLAGQTAIYGVSSIVGRFLNYLLVPLYTYTFPPEKYGIVTEFYAYVVVLQILLTYGMETGFFRFSQKPGYDERRVFSTVLISVFTTSTLFVFLIFLFNKKISALLGYSEHPEFVKIFAVILAADAVSAIFFAKLRQENKALKFAFLKILSIVINIGLNLFFILLCPKIAASKICFFYNPDFGVGYIFVANLIASASVLLIFFLSLPKIRFTFDFALWKKIISYSLPLLVAGLTGSINEMADRILLKYWTVVPEGVADKTAYVLYQLGIYGANAKLAVLMMLFVQAFRYASEPFFFSYAKKNKDFSVFADVMKYYVAFAMLMFLAIMLNLDIVKYFIGSQYYEGLKVVFPLFLSRFLVGVFFILSFWYKLNDITKYGMIIFIIGAVITVSLNRFMIPHFGYMGAAWTNFTAYFVMVLISYFWSRKYLKVKYDFKRIFLYVFSAILFYFVSKQIDFQNFMLNLLVKNLFLAVYVFLVLKTENLSLKKLLNFKPLKTEQ